MNRALMPVWVQGALPQECDRGIVGARLARDNGE